MTIRGGPPEKRRGKNKVPSCVERKLGGGWRTRGKKKKKLREKKQRSVSLR